jgi:DNA-binding NarL/FixJ family response regulator
LEVRVDPLLTKTTKVLVLDLGGGAASRALVGARGITVLMVRSFGEAGRILPVGPSAIVVALAGPEPEAVASVAKLVKAAGGVPVLVVSEPVGGDRVVEFIKAGVKGYLFASDVGHLAESVRELVRGGLPMSEPVSSLVLGRARRPSGEFGAIARPIDSVPPHSTERSSLPDTQRFPARQRRRV